MHEIEANRAVRIDNIIYSSMHFTAHPFQQLMRFIGRSGHTPLRDASMTC